MILVLGACRGSRFERAALAYRVRPSRQSTNA